MQLWVKTEVVDALLLAATTYISSSVFWFSDLYQQRRKKWHWKKETFQCRCSIIILKCYCNTGYYAHAYKILTATMNHAHRINCICATTPTALYFVYQWLQTNGQTSELYWYNTILAHVYEMSMLVKDVLARQKHIWNHTHYHSFVVLLVKSVYSSLPIAS